MKHRQPIRLSGGQNNRVIAIARLRVGRQSVRFYWPTNQQEISTAEPATKSWRCCETLHKGARPSSWSRTSPTSRTPRQANHPHEERRPGALRCCQVDQDTVTHGSRALGPVDRFEGGASDSPHSVSSTKACILAARRRSLDGTSALPAYTTLGIVISVWLPSFDDHACRGGPPRKTVIQNPPRDRFRHESTCSSIPIVPRHPARSETVTNPTRSSLSRPAF